MERSPPTGGVCADVARRALTVADALEVLGRLAAADISAWVDGGWGVDALVGEQTRLHDDLDVVVARADLARVARAFRGWERVEREWWPARFVLHDRGGRQVDFHPVRLDERGDGWQTLPDGSLGRYPRAGLAGRGTIAGHSVRCTSAELQLAHHMYPDPDDVDWHDVHLLARRFGLRVPERYRSRPGFVDARRPFTHLP